MYYNLIVLCCAIILAFQQMRRSNRQVKRKKYTEDLDIKITDDEDEPGEDIDVITPVAVLSTGHSQTLGTSFQELEGDGLPSMQFFVVRLSCFLVVARFTIGLHLLSNFM